MVASSNGLSASLSPFPPPPTFLYKKAASRAFFAVLRFGVVLPLFPGKRVLLVKQLTYLFLRFTEVWVKLSRLQGVLNCQNSGAS